MAYSHPNLHRIGPANSNAPVIWTYNTSDNVGVVDGSGYFNDASDDLQVNDLIFAACGDGAGFFLVNSNSSGVVDVDNVTTIGGTDSD